MASIKEIRELKEEIQDAQANKSKLEGKLEELINQLEQRFGITSIEDAQILLERKKAEGLKLEAQFKEALTSLEAQVEW